MIPYPYPFPYPYPYPYPYPEYNPVYKTTCCP